MTITRIATLLLFCFSTALHATSWRPITLEAFLHPWKKAVASKIMNTYKINGYTAALICYQDLLEELEYDQHQQNVAASYRLDAACKNMRFDKQSVRHPESPEPRIDDEILSTNYAGWGKDEWTKWFNVYLWNACRLGKYYKDVCEQFNNEFAHIGKEKQRYLDLQKRLLQCQERPSEDDHVAIPAPFDDR